MIKQCPRPINVVMAATRKIDYYAKKDRRQTHAVQMVLADLCMPLEDPFRSDDGDNAINTDAEVFQFLLNVDTTKDASVSEVLESDGSESKVYLINYEHANVYHNTFLGACIDSAAEKSVIGKPQAELYSQLYGLPFNLEPSKARPSFSFGTHRHIGLGKLDIRVPISEDYFLPLKIEVVNIDIPFLLGLDSMTKYGMVLDIHARTLSSKLDGWEVPLIRKRGHFYYEWDFRILFTEAELRKVHKHFFHPKPEKLYALMKRADPSATASQVLKDLENIDATCDPCRRFANAPNRFKVSLPSANIVFNREICMEIMSLNHKQVLHAVDCDTKFNVARFLKD